MKTSILIAATTTILTALPGLAQGQPAAGGVGAGTGSPAATGGTTPTRRTMNPAEMGTAGKGSPNATMAGAGAGTNVSAGAQPGKAGGGPTPGIVGANNPAPVQTRGGGVLGGNGGGFGRTGGINR